MPLTEAARNNLYNGHKVDGIDVLAVGAGFFTERLGNGHQRVVLAYLNSRGAAGAIEVEVPRGVKKNLSVMAVQYALLSNLEASPALKIITHDPTVPQSLSRSKIGMRRSDSLVFSNSYRNHPLVRLPKSICVLQSKYNGNEVSKLDRRSKSIQRAFSKNVTPLLDPSHPLRLPMGT